MFIDSDPMFINFMKLYLFDFFLSFVFPLLNGISKSKNIKVERSMKKISLGSYPQSFCPHGRPEQPPGTPQAPSGTFSPPQPRAPFLDATLHVRKKKKSLLTGRRAADFGWCFYARLSAILYLTGGVYTYPFSPVHVGSMGPMGVVRFENILVTTPGLPS